MKDVLCCTVSGKMYLILVLYHDRCSQMYSVRKDVLNSSIASMKDL